MKIKHNIRTIVVTLFIIVLAISMYVNIRGGYLEYKELGENYISIFETNLKYKYISMGVNFVLIYWIMYFSTRGIKKGLKVFFDEEKKEMPKLPNKSISFIVSVILSVVVGAVFTPKLLLCASNVSFEKTDMIFNLDISFYMFFEPLIKMIILYIIGIFVFLISYSAGYYILVFNKYFDGIDRETLKKSYLIKYIIRYVRIIAIGFAIYTLVRTLDIVFSSFISTNTGLGLTGAGVVDTTIKIFGNIIFAIVIIIATFFAAFNFKKEKLTKSLKNILIIPAYLVCMFVVMFSFDLIFVNKDEYDKQKKYIERNISYTKEAYGINCDDETIEYSGTITEKEVENNKDIINNALLMDKKEVLEILNKEQDEKGYYTYKTVGLVKTNINGEDKILYISPKEILNSRRTFNSKTFEYTHGYGVVAVTAANQKMDGFLEYNDVEINTPQIYYGLANDSIAITNVNQKNEYDYTDNKGIEYTSAYNGESGLNLGFLDRLILGMKKGNIHLAFSGNVKNNSKILLNRNIIKRAQVALSNVIYDENPYMVINDDGDMYWVLDAYTTSSNYPYSTYTNIVCNNERKSINYIRNSIKVIINAYNGEMKFYITDTTDPIAMAYRKIYPGLFESLESKILEDISRNFVYPEFLYNVQASMLEEYHNTKSEVLYRGDDSWKKLSYTTVKNSKSVTSTLDSYYTIVKDDDKESIGLVQIYSPNGKQSITSYLVGNVVDGNNKLKIYKLSSVDGILGINQLDNQISQDENIKKEIDKLDVTGAKVTKKMTVVPIENTLLYIEQIYQTKTNETNEPILKKVVVASGNKIAIGNNLEEAVESIVSKYATSIETYTADDLEGLLQSIIKANKNLSSSMKSNDWEIMGTDIKKLQELINKLEIKLETENING